MSKFFFIKLLKNLGNYWMPILLGLALFFVITGGGILYPTNIDWLKGDEVNSLYAWEFFRHTPIFQNPLGQNYSYGMGMGGSIVYAEPLFLFAFPFKLFSFLLPTPFQYLGSWVLLSFVLQAIFSWKLIEKITDDRLFQLFGSFFFVLAPPFLWRFHGHLQFLGQWLILAGIWLYLSKAYSRYGWLCLLITTSLVHPYFLFMLLAMWGADLIKRIYSNELNYLKTIQYIFINILIVLLVLWQEGYFILPGGYEAFGFGYFRMNLLSFIDPTDWGEFNSWSRFLPKQLNTPGDYEGFSYLGLGMILLGVLIIPKFLESSKKYFILIIKKNLTLLLIAFLLMLFALSNHIVFGKYEVFSYKVPQFFNIFRASGRMALPIFYLCYLGIFYLTVKLYKKSISRLLIFSCLCIQCIDSSNTYINCRNWLSHSSPYISPLKSTIWKEAAKKYKNFIYLFPEYNFTILPFVHYAAFHHLNINMGYFARLDVKKITYIKDKLMNNIFNGNFDKDSMYVVKEEQSKRIKINSKTNFPYNVVQSDGYILILPNWKNYSSTFESFNWSKNNLYRLGTIISLESNESNFKDYLFEMNGWSTPEGKGAWTEGDNSSFFLKLEERPMTNLSLTIKAFPFINLKHPNLKVDLLVNNHFVGTLNYQLNNFEFIKKINIPNSFFNKNNLLKIQFLFKKSISPVKLNMSTDGRSLGLFVSSLSLDSEKTL